MDYNTLASKEIVNKTVQALNGHNIETFITGTSAEALAKIKELIPKGASVMNGSSVTLEQIGFVEYLKSGDHGWDNLHARVLNEKDPVKQLYLRKQAILSDYYLGSVHALTQTGEFVIGSNTGSQLPHIVYSSQNLVFVAGTQKIVPDFPEAMKRLEDYVFPLEDKHIKEKFGVGTMLSKVVIFKNENPRLGRKVRMILVNEKLGF